MSKKNDPSPICDHGDRFVHRVTNVPDEVPSAEAAKMSYRGTWVCERRACVLDAMAWVERAGAGNAIIYDQNRQAVTL
jgi:predicted RNA-binding protein YlxR (DUF448 family)